MGAEAQAEQQRDLAARAEQFPAEGLQPVDAADLPILLGAIHRELLTLEKIRPLEKNPDVYSSGVTTSIYVLMSRKFAPADERLRRLSRATT